MSDEVSSRLEVTLLGTGTSTGVPIIGCSCRVCRSDDPKDQRLRCSCLVTVGDMQIMIDTGPDFRRQALRENISRVDAVLYTHHHFDHVAGMDDLRPFLFDNKKPIPCYTHPASRPTIEDSYSYIFKDGSYPGIPRLRLEAVDEPFTVDNRYFGDAQVRVIPIEVMHGNLPVHGFRIGRFAYLTDTSEIPEDRYAQLKNLDVLVLDALRHRPHRKHLSFEQAIRAARRINANETYFIHMTHDVLHAEVEASLPDTIHLGYDGLKLQVETPE
jgi:phosphoribosyl 1,2-cyclic phosphate phosphodiesterase